MTNETEELRDRIADVLWRTEEKSWEDQAQAIIDDLGLETETVSLRFMDPSGPFPQTRVIGKWETP